LNDAIGPDEWTSFPHVRETLVRWGLLEGIGRQEELATRLGINVTKIEIRHREPASGLFEFFLGHRPDLIVLSTHGREGPYRWLSSSVSRSLGKRISRHFLPTLSGGCVPDSATIRAGVYETRGFGVGFSGNNTGRIRLLCPYHLHSDALGAKIGIIFLSVIDDDGMEVGARVRAHLRRASLASNVAITIGICDSNTSNFPGPHNIGCFGPSHTIERTNPRVNVEFLSVGMRCDDKIGNKFGIAAHGRICLSPGYDDTVRSAPT
jgi:hypothetical protein